MKRIKIAYWMFIILVIYWIVYNSIFGWNLEPINEAEILCDNISEWLLCLTIGFYFSPLLDIYKKIVEVNNID